MLEEIKALLGLSGEEKDALLNTILSLTKKRLCVLLGGIEEVPKALSYIVTEVSVRRFNRIGSEGSSSHTVEGESYTWSDDDFLSYRLDIEGWMRKNKGTGKVRFL